MKDPNIRMKLRKIKNGEIRIHGLRYVPNETHRAYKGELDGLRMAFYPYEFRGESVNMWGSEAMYHAQDDAAFKVAYQTNPALLDGCFPWDFWRKRA